MGGRGRTTVYFSSSHPKFALDSIPLHGPSGAAEDVGSLRADGTVSPFVQNIEVPQPPLSHSGTPHIHIVPGSPPIPCQLEKPLQPDAHLSNQAGIVSHQDLSSDAIITLENLSNAVAFLAGLITDTTSIPTKSTVVILKSLLRSFGPKLVRSLDTRQSSELLCLLGTISDDGSGRKYHNAWDNKGRGWGSLDVDGCWDEVVQLAQVKEKMGHVFGERENFWSMRAYLKHLRVADSPGQRTMANAYYSRIPLHLREKRIVFDPYLETFLSLPLSSEFYNALDILLEIFAKNQNPDKAIIRLLWRVILRRGHQLPSAYKSRILNLLHYRLPISSKQTNIHPGLHDVVSALATSIFPCPTALALPTSISAWVSCCIRTSLLEEISVDERFNNLVLITMWLVPKELPPSPLPGTASRSHEWRAIVGLAVLNRFFDRETEHKTKGLQDLIRLFWRYWKKNASASRPKQIDCLVVASFFKAAAYLEDSKLFNACIKYASQQSLWGSSPDSELEPYYLEQLYTSFAACILALKGQFQDGLLSFLAGASLSLSQHSRYIHIVLQQLVDHDVEFAHQFYCDCLTWGISIPSETSIPLAQKLALLQRWDDVLPFLQTSRMSNVSLERLLETILSVFRCTRQELIIPAVAKTIGDILLRLYSTTPIPNRLKYPIRFFLPIMVASNHSELATRLLEIFTRNNPVMYTARFYLRIIQTLLNYRQPRLAVDVLGLAATSHRVNPSALEALRCKTFRGLVHVGAHKLAYKIIFVHPPRQHIRQRLLRLYARRPSYSVKLALFRLLPSLCTPPAGSSIILSAVQVSIRNRHFGLARKLIEQCCKQLKSRDLTTICNVYLHGPLRYWNMRSGRLVRHVLKTKDLLERRYGFVPDRATVNIVIKAMLRWRSFMNSRKVRSLFDHLVRNGYPSSGRWNTANGVPFGTPPGRMTLNLTDIRRNMSFKRHVRPLYRMFIKELFLRKDSWGGRRVVGILKEAEISAMERKEHREQVRRLGIMKKQRRRALDREQGSR